jgi:O-antigen/teichoic acid export membrane protein
METKIRLRYSGLLLFLARIVGMFGGLAFIILVVKNLSTEDLGAWQWISKIISYALIPSYVVNFWVARSVARDYSTSRTGIVLNSLLLVPVSAVYILLIPVLANAIEFNTLPFVVAIAFVPLYYLLTTLTYIAGGTAPQNMAYSEIVFESTKILFAFSLVFSLHLALVGTIVTVEFAILMTIAILIFLSRKYLHSGFRKDVAKQWMSRSWLSGYISQSGTLLSLDTIVVVAVAGLQATTVLAYFTIAITISGMVGLATSLTGGLTPKLLKGGKVTDIEAVLELTLMFGVPMLVGTFVIAGPLVDLFQHQYSVATAITRILLFSAFLDLISNLADTVVMGTVDIDKGKPGFKQLAKSKLFLLPSINFIMGAIYLVGLFIILTLSISGMPADAYQISVLWAVVLVVAKVPLVSIKFWLSRRVMKFRIPYRGIAKYLIGSGVMAVILFYSLNFVVYNSSFTKYFFYPLALVGVGSLTYAVVMLLIDKDFRQLARAVLRRK